MRTPDNVPSEPDRVPAGDTPLSRAALALYPPAWRARYGDEVRALLEESGGGLGAAASLAWRAMPAWIWPPRHLYDRPARVRASLATVLMAWSVLVAAAMTVTAVSATRGARAALAGTTQASPIDH